MHNFPYRQYPLFSPVTLLLYLCFDDIVCAPCLPSLLLSYLCFHYLLWFAYTGRWSTISWRKSFMMFIDETFVRTVSLYPVQLPFVFRDNALLFRSLSVSCIKWDSQLGAVQNISFWHSSCLSILTEWDSVNILRLAWTRSYTSLGWRLQGMSGVCFQRNAHL